MTKCPFGWTVGPTNSVALRCGTEWIDTATQGWLGCSSITDWFYGLRGHHRINQWNASTPLSSPFFFASSWVFLQTFICHHFDLLFGCPNFMSKYVWIYVHNHLDVDDDLEAASIISLGPKTSTKIYPDKVVSPNGYVVNQSPKS